MSALRILIADDHAAIRRGMRSLLESQPKWEVCGEATNGREASELSAQLKPDVALLDLAMPEVNGLEAARRILKDAPETVVLILSTHEAEELTEEVLRVGVQGIILKSDAHGLIAMIESLQGNGKAIHLADSIVGHSRHIGALF